MNTDFDENRKEFWAFVGRKSKGKKKNIASLKSDIGLSLTSTRGKLEVLQRHYQLLSKMSVDGVFDTDWKEEVEENVINPRHMRSEGYCSCRVCVCLSVCYSITHFTSGYSRPKRTHIFSGGWRSKKTAAFESDGVKHERKSQYANKHVHIASGYCWY